MIYGILGFGIALLLVGLASWISSATLIREIRQGVERVRKADALEDALDALDFLEQEELRAVRDTADAMLYTGHKKAPDTVGGADRARTEPA